MNPAERTVERYGAVTVLRGPRGGAYPSGNTLRVTGRDGVLLVDPSKDLDPALGAGADAVLVSHAHEDHMASLGRYDVPVHVHEADLAGARDVGAMFGADAAAVGGAAFLASLAEEFDLSSRPDATPFRDGSTFDLGDRRVIAVHLPGHTAGHCGFLVEPDGFFFVADIDLSSFGPYYGDPGSSLEQFEASLLRCREIEARWYGTFHQKGVIPGPDDFARRLDAFRAVIEARETRLVDHLREPRRISDVVAHRLVYRPHVEGPHVEGVERRTAERHVARLVGAGRVEEVEPGRFRVVAP